MREMEKEREGENKGKKRERIDGKEKRGKR